MSKVPIHVLIIFIESKELINFYEINGLYYGRMLSGSLR